MVFSHCHVYMFGSLPFSCCT